jgi:probable HAF family extracellular repeat protein
MKSKTGTRTTTLLLFATLAIPVGVAAQDQQKLPNQPHHYQLVQIQAQGKQDHKNAKHPHYRLIDLGTLGGPIGYGSVNGDGFRLLNNSGSVVSYADTPFPDPNQAYLCFDPDCYQGHGFSWKNGVMTDLGTLPGNSNSAAGSINSHGWVTGQSQSSTIDPNLGIPEFRAVLWRHHQITDLGTLPGGSEALGIFVNDSNQVVGFSDNGIPDPYSFPFFFTGTQIHTFFWKNGTMEDIGTLGGPDAVPGADCGVAPADQIVGFSYTSYSPNSWTGIPTLDPFLWNHGVMTDLGTLGGTEGFAQCVNHHGQIIGNSDLSGDLTTHAFLWQDAAMADLGTLGGDYSVAIWLNEVGDVAGFAALPDQSHHPVIWKDRQIKDLGTVANDACGQALSVNARGQVVGGTSDCNYFLHAFLWEDGGPMLDLNTLIPAGSGLQLTFALDINDRGEILAKALPPGGNPYQDSDLYGHLVLLVPCEGESESCQASLSPIPATLPLAGSTLAGKPNPYSKASARSAKERIDLRRQFAGSYSK